MTKLLIISQFHTEEKRHFKDQPTILPGWVACGWGLCLLPVWFELSSIAESYSFYRNLGRLQSVIAGILAELTVAKATVKD